MTRTLFGAMGTTFLVQAVGLVTGVVVARSLGVEGRGEFAFLITWGTFISYLAELGGPPRLALVVAHGWMDHRTLSGAFTLFSMAQLMGALVLTACFAALVGGFLPERSGSVASYFWFWLCFLPGNALWRYVTSILQGGERFTQFNLVRLLTPSSYLLLVVALYFIARPGLDGFLLANAMGYWVAAIVGLVLIGSSLRPRFGAAFEPDAWRSAATELGHGARAHLGTLQPFWTLQVDLALVAALGTLRGAGLYAIAAAAGALISTQGRTVAMVAMPAVARARSTGADPVRIAIRYVVIALVAMTGTAVLLAAFARPIITFVFGVEFADAAPILRVLVFAGVMAGIARTLAECMRGLGSSGYATVAEAVVLVTGMVGVVLAVRIGGEVAAAWSVALAAVCGLLIVGLGSLRVLRARPTSG